MPAIVLSLYALCSLSSIATKNETGTPDPRPEPKRSEVAMWTIVGLLMIVILALIAQVTNLPRKKNDSVDKQLNQAVKCQTNLVSSNETT